MLYESFIHPLTILSGLPSAVVGGLVVSQSLTLYITPVLYLYMEDFSRWLDGLRRGRGQARPATAVADAAE